MVQSLCVPHIFQTLERLCCSLVLRRKIEGTTQLRKVLTRNIDGSSLISGLHKQGQSKETRLQSLRSPYHETSWFLSGEVCLRYPLVREAFQFCSDVICPQRSSALRSVWFWDWSDSEICPSISQRQGIVFTLYFCRNVQIHDQSDTEVIPSVHSFSGFGLS